MIFDKEALASLCHDQWSGWMRYLFSKSFENDDATVTIPRWAVERWQRQMNTPYESLTEQEKDSDRAEADKFIALDRSGVVERAFKAGFSIGYSPASDPHRIDDEWKKWVEFMGTRETA